MTLETAVILLLCAAVGIAASRICLRQKKDLRTICIVLLSLLALALTVYIGLIIFFVDAVSHQPPV